jgi:enoyl-CoA hydratase
MTRFENLIYEKKNGIARITINRPEVRNALNIETRRELKTALEDTSEDENVKVVVITGAGDRAFCAGADIREFLEFHSLQMREYLQLSRAVTNKIMNMEKPVIAAVNGYALGGGCELAMACDMIVASENARFGQPEIIVGLIPGGGGTQRLPRLIGEKRARELIYTGDIINAKEAERLGLVNKVVPADKLDETLNELLQKLLNRSPALLKIAKATINRSMDTTLTAGLSYELEACSLCFSTEDQKEGARAFLEKRKPVYKGK